MRDGEWSLAVQQHGSYSQPAPEHIVDGHTCVESRPGEMFAVTVKFHGQGMYVIDLLVDGKSAAGKRVIDATGETAWRGTFHHYSGFEKLSESQLVISKFTYSHTDLSDDGGATENAGSGMATQPVNWSHGKITLLVYPARKSMLTKQQVQTPGVTHNPDLSKPAAMSEKDMIKGGHTLSATGGTKIFSNSKRSNLYVGQFYVQRTSLVPVQEISIFYRDSFFLGLRGDPSKLLDPNFRTPASSAAPGSSGESVKRERDYSVKRERGGAGSSAGAPSKQPKVIDLV